MIIENVKERLSAMQEDLDFIKECLWQHKPRKIIKGA